MNAYVGNDNVVRLTGAKAVLLSTGVSQFLGASATVQFRLQTRDGVDVAGDSWAQTMTYIVGSEGNFLGVLRDTVLLEPDEEYWFIGTVDAGMDQKGSWDPIPLRTYRRRG